MGPWMFERWSEVKLMEIVMKRIKAVIKGIGRVAEQVDKNLGTASKLNKVISGRDSVIHLF